MKKITREDLAATAAERWSWQYRDYTEEGFVKIANALSGLGPHPTPDEVDGIIGNDGWTHLICAECKTAPEDFSIQVGEEEGWDSATVNLCSGCIQKLIKLLPEKELNKVIEI